MNLRNEVEVSLAVSEFVILRRLSTSVVFAFDKSPITAPTGRAKNVDAEITHFEMNQKTR
ncbi:MAG TPA: hypothetical protein VGZ00_00025 [Candidatus Baltobacteraceae bacterium]|nr:hypothetical protein [Candidatus Baltobacteraceae bacterium]